MRANEFLTELFKPGKHNWKWEFRGSEEVSANFTVGQVPYKFYAFTSPGAGGKWEVEFSIDTTQLPSGKRYNSSFGLTKSGNAATVMSIVSDIMRDFLQRYQGSVTELTFTADESSRQALYARMAKRLLPTWEIVQSGKNFTLAAPNPVTENFADGKILLCY